MNILVRYFIEQGCRTIDIWHDINNCFLHLHNF